MVSPLPCCVCSLAKLAWLIFVYLWVKMVNAVSQALCQTARTVLFGSVGVCRRSPHSVVAGIWQFSGHLAEISVPWQMNSKNKTQLQNLLNGHGETMFFILHFVPHYHERGHYAAKFRSELIVFGSAVSDDIRNHIASVLLESVNIFFVF